MEEKDMKLLDRVLCASNLTNLRDKFVSEKVTVKLIPLLTDEQLVSLGVKRIGDQIMLKSASKNMKDSGQISSEINSLFPSCSSSSSTGIESHQDVVMKANRLITCLRSSPGDISGHHLKSSKKKRKLYHSEKEKECCKNLVLIEYPGDSPPEVQALRDYHKLYEGSLTFTTSMTEEQIRWEIAGLIREKESIFNDYKEITGNDFSFVRCANRKVRLPDGQTSFDGNGIRRVYRTGAVYVRLTKSFSTETSSPPSELPDDIDTTPITTMNTPVSPDDLEISYPCSPITLSDHYDPGDKIYNHEVSGAPSSPQSKVSELAPTDSQLPVETVTPSERHYREYCGLIDLTEESDRSDVESEPPSDHIEKMEKFSRLEIELLLKEHFSSNVKQDEYQKINVRRKFILADATKQFRRKSFEVGKIIQVSFIGEAAIDTGGPRREFFRLLTAAILSNSSIFEGYPASVIPSHNITALNNQEYYFAGKMISTGIIQGGPAPRCFAAPVADILVYGEIKSVTDILEIPDIHIRDKLVKLKQAESEEEIKDIFVANDYSFQFECGYLKRVVTLKDVQEFLHAAWLHYTVYNIYGEISQLKEGVVSTLNFQNLITSNPQAMRSLFVFGKSTLSAPFLQEAFIIDYSLNGSNDKSREEAVIMNFFDFLQDCEDNTEDTDVSLGDVLTFITGVNEVPPLGFDQPLKVEFVVAKCLPSASTCTLTLKLSRQMVDYCTFKEQFKLAILGGHGFGNV